MTAAVGGPTLRPLSIEECWERLATVLVGRVAVPIPGEAPLVVPVNHRVDARTVVFRSGPGTKLDVARREQISFQADAVDPYSREGWSVLVRGVATLEGGPHGLDDPTPWAGHRHDTVLVRLWPEHVSGRCIVPDELEYEPHGYL